MEQSILVKSKLNSAEQKQLYVRGIGRRESCGSLVTERNGRCFALDFQSIYLATPPVFCMSDVLSSGARNLG